MDLYQKFGVRQASVDDFAFLDKLDDSGTLVGRYIMRVRAHDYSFEIEQIFKVMGEINEHFWIKELLFITDERDDFVVLQPDRTWEEAGVRLVPFSFFVCLPDYPSYMRLYSNLSDVIGAIEQINAWNQIDSDEDIKAPCLYPIDRA